MYQSWCRLTLYSETKGSILYELALIWRDLERGDFDRERLAHRLNAQVKRLLDLSTEYGFDGNLWQNYLTFLMVSTVHSFGLACERTGAMDGTITRSRWRISASSGGCSTGIFRRWKRPWTSAP